MAKYKILMTCFDADPRIRPYEDQLARYFDTREAARDAVEKCVADELETLNSGKAEGEFVGNFYQDDHEAVVEFWEGEPTEGDRDMRPVTIYDIVTVQTPYKVTIKETLIRTVVIWGDDEYDAYEKAEELCNNGTINLVSEDFSGRECECRGVADQTAIAALENYGREK